MSQIESKIKEIIVKDLGVKESEVTRTASFVNDLGADSLDCVELVIDFEKEFGIEIDENDAYENIITVGDAINYINKLI